MELRFSALIETNVVAAAYLSQHVLFCNDQRDASTLMLALVHGLSEGVIALGSSKCEVK